MRLLPNQVINSIQLVDNQFVYIDSFSKDSALKPHGFRNNLQAKFDAAGTPNKTSGHLIGWKNQDTVGMQKEYNKQGYMHLQLLQVLKACHGVEEWAS